MELRYCERELEVIAAVRSGLWPDGADESLRRHAERCAACSDAALVAAYLAQEAASAGEEAARASLPHPGLVWWRAEIMARREAAERAAQPIALAQRAALAAGIAILAAALAIYWFRLQTLRPSITRWFVASRAADVVSSVANGASRAVLVASLTACLMLAGFVLYIIWAEE